MTVRNSDPDDVSGLTELYDGLSLDDRYHRFFSGSMPKDFVEKWIHVTEQGGVGLVAVVANGGEHIVAEAGVALLPDGDGELALTVAREWRGWLGPFLLDALVQEAAARGIPNLQAEILVDNGAMFSLVRSRGYAILDHGDWSSVRVTIGTAGYPPDWPEADDRPRVLVETPGGRWPAANAGGQRLADHRVSRTDTVAGWLPGSRGPSVPPCGACRRDRLRVPPSDAQAQAILSEHPRLHEGVPLVVAPASSAAGL